MLDKSVNITDLLARLGGAPAEQSDAAEVKKKSGPVADSPRSTDAPPAGGPRLTAQPPPKPRQEPQPRREDQPPQPVKLDGPLDLDAIRANWTAVVARIRQASQTLAAQLVEAEAVAWDDKVLRLKIPAEGYSATRLQDRQTRRQIAECLRSVFGADEVSVVIEIVRPEPEEQSKGPEPDNNISSGSFEQLCRTDPLMGKIKELFDPELLDQ